MRQQRELKARNALEHVAFSYKHVQIGWDYIVFSENINTVKYNIFLIQG